MTRRFVYTDKVGAGPEHPKKRWGLYSTELSVEEAAARYAMDAVRREAWFGIVLIEPGEEQPREFLQMCPRANGVELNKLDEHGSIEVSYAWRAYYTPSDSLPYAGDQQSVFLSTYTWYAYPEEPRFFPQMSSIGHVSMTFGIDGYAKEERVTKRGFGQPSDVETREFRDVDVTVNWTRIPEFGDWDAFFHPESAAKSD